MARSGDQIPPATSDQAGGRRRRRRGGRRGRARPDGGVDVVFVVAHARTVGFLGPLIEALAADGVRCGVVTNFDGNPPPERLQPVLAWWADVPIHRNPSPVADLRDLVRLWWLFRRVRPSVVSASTPKGGLLGVLAARAAAVPHVVYQVRGFRAEHARGAGRRLHVALESLTLRAAHDVVFNSESLLRTMDANGLPVAGGVVLGRGSSVGVDCVRFSPTPMAIDDAVPVVGFVGRVHTDKGMNDLLAAFGEVRATLGDAELVVVGDADPTDPSSAALLEQLHDRPGVRYVGPTREIPAMMATFHCLALPTWREGLPNVVLEAQACGRPVVGYAATGVVDAVADGVGGVLVPVGDVGAFAAALRSVLSDLPAAARMGAAGRRYVEEHFEQGAVVERYVWYYRDLLGRGVSRRG
ncbi:MAG: glycosyltransferase [Acidimicrobiia bacterium]|nr:glycosyltransferase [Acidimicrobiia bacterium]